MTATSGEHVPAEDMSPMEAAEWWEGHHHRHHQGELADCDSLLCEVASDMLTAPSATSGGSGVDR